MIVLSLSWQRKYQRKPRQKNRSAHKPTHGRRFLAGFASFRYDLAWIENWLR
jgi:hypothetical protein